MLQFDSMQAALPVFKALSAPARVRILQILYQEGDKNLNDLAALLGMTNSAVSLHIGKLEQAGLIEIRSMPGRHGAMKLCRCVHDKLLVDLCPPATENAYYDEIQIGHYTRWEARPTCGLASAGGIIGELDDPRYFSFPERFQAQILWFSAGFVEYELPNNLRAGERPTALSVSMELSSEAPGFCDDYPSDIYFSLNGTPLGYWVSPGDFGGRRGRFSPNWWGGGLNQFGLLKSLIINRNGTFIDGGSKIGDVTIDGLQLDYNAGLTLRISAPANARNPGGLTLFGAGFGDYNQAIQVKMSYEAV